MAGDSDAIPGGIVLPHGMSEEDRRDFVSNVLVTKKVVTSTAPRKSADSSSSTNKTLKSDLVINKPPPKSSSFFGDDSQQAEVDASYSEDACAICLTEYEEGDEICWSHNKECNHAFHRECILEWLIRHDDCPCCRHNYLCLDDNDEEGNNREVVLNNNNNNNNNTEGNGNNGLSNRDGAGSSPGNSHNRRFFMPGFLSSSLRGNQTAMLSSGLSVELTTSGTIVTSPSSVTTSSSNTGGTNNGENMNNTGNAGNNSSHHPSENNISPTGGMQFVGFRSINWNGSEEREIVRSDSAQEPPEGNVVSVEDSRELFEGDDLANGEIASVRQEDSMDAERTDIGPDSSQEPPVENTVNAEDSQGLPEGDDVANDEVVSLRQEDSIDADSNLSNEVDETIMTAVTTGLRVVDAERRDDDAFDNVTENVPITVEGS